MKNVFLGLLLLTFLFTFAAAQPGSLDPTFGGGDGIAAYSTIAGINRDAVLQSDGKLVTLAGGPNSTFRLMRINVDGSLDTSFNGSGSRSFQWGLTYNNGSYSGTAWTIGIQNIAGSERIVVAGQAPRLSGKSVQNFIRLDRFMPDGTIDTSFGTNGTVSILDGVAYDIVVQPGQKILGIAQNSNKVFRLNAGGTLDGTFGSGGVFTGSGTLQRLALDPDGSILVTSTFTVGNGKNGHINIEVRKYNTNGSLNSSFGTNGSAKFGRLNYDFVPKSITVDTLHNVLIGTLAWTPNQDFAAVRFTQNGLVDTTFAASGLFLAGYSAFESRAPSALMEGDGKIVLIGGVNNSPSSGPMDAMVIRLNYNGSLDTSFGSSGFSIFNIDGNDYVSLGPGGVIQYDTGCSCEKILVVSGRDFLSTFARLTT